MYCTGNTGPTSDVSHRLLKIPEINFYTPESSLKISLIEIDLDFFIPSVDILKNNRIQFEALYIGHVYNQKRLRHKSVQKDYLTEMIV